MLVFCVCHVLADVNVEDLTKRIYKFFGSGTVYDLPLNDPYRKKGGTVPASCTCPSHQTTCQYSDVCICISVINFTGLKGWESLCYCLICFSFPLMGNSLSMKIFHTVRLPCSWLLSRALDSCSFFLLLSYKCSAAVNHPHSTGHRYSKLQAALRLRIIEEKLCHHHGH